MRRAPLLSGLTLGLYLAAGAAAQGPPETNYTAEVVQSEAVVRCGPSDKFYPTNRLKPGEKVTVLGSDPSRQYLRIAPPPGSFSWIEARHVKQLVPNLPNYAVSEPGVEAPVYTGSEFEEQSKRHPNHESCKLKWGTQVRAVGAPHTDDAGTWLPIEPPPAEARYVPAAAVKRLAETVAAARPASPPSEPNMRPVPAAAPAVVPAVVETPSALAPLESPQLKLFRDAQAAERQGTVYGLSEAIRLYDRVAQEAADPILAAQARDAASRVRKQYTAYTKGANSLCPPPETPCSPAYTPPGRVYPTPAEPPAPSPGVRLNPPASTAPVVVSQTVSVSSAPSPRPPENAGSYSERGYLKRAGRTVEGRTTYRLESPTGYPLYYVTAQPGVNLEAYLNQYVEVSGPAIYHGALRANYMTAARVQPLQP